ncbi:hypothetical protein A6C57_23560 [Fibrella sp. ES10-3-2-2]|nr:hypothetical protein A6C57_23560 [Fibrella sp. ES10-3-2-2]
MTGYELTKAFYEELANNEAMQLQAKPHHLSLYTWICELRNRVRMDVVDLPREYTMRMSLIGSPTTLKGCIEDLEKWDIIEVLTKGNNGWSGSTKVKISCSYMNRHRTATVQLPNSNSTGTEQAPNSSSTTTVQQPNTTKREKTVKEETINNQQLNNELVQVAGATTAPVQVDSSSPFSGLRSTPSFAKPTEPVVPNEAPAAKKSTTVDKPIYGDGELQALCREYFKQHPDKYPGQLYNDFLTHWTAIARNAKKKSDNGKEVWRTRETFDIAGRLSTWSKNQEKFNDGNQPDKRTPTPGRIDAKSTTGATTKWRGNKLIRPGSTPEPI